jgi:hypothetical protein
MAAMSMKAAHNYSLFDCKSRVFPWSSSGGVVPNCERHPTFGISNREDLGVRLLATRSANAVSGYSFIIAILRLRDAVGSCAEVEAQRHPKTGANINAVL